MTFTCFVCAKCHSPCQKSSPFRVYARTDNQRPNTIALCVCVCAMRKWTRGNCDNGTAADQDEFLRRIEGQKIVQKGDKGERKEDEFVLFILRSISIRCLYLTIPAAHTHYTLFTPNHLGAQVVRSGGLTHTIPRPWSMFNGHMTLTWAYWFHLNSGGK